MYIYPNSVIHVLRGVDCDKHFNHVRYFDNRQKQLEYMLSKRAFTFYKTSYVKNNTVKLEVRADLIYDCNYLMYQNTSFGNRWFFAFIDSVSYISNNVSEITYTVDLYQTWFLDCNVGECFVEREHVSNDEKGVNTIQEGINAGELVVASKTKLTDFTSDLYYGVLANLTQSQWQSLTHTGLYKDTSDVRGNILQGASIILSKSSEAIKDFLTQVVEEMGYSNAILSVFTLPADLSPIEVTFNLTGSPSIQKRATLNTTINLPNLPNNFDGYIPRNNKCFTFPYCEINVFCPTGANISLKPELFNTFNTNRIKLRSDVSATPTLYFCPSEYKGVDVDNTNLASVEFCVQGSFAYDSYQAKLASTGAYRPEMFGGLKDSHGNNPVGDIFANFKKFGQDLFSGGTQLAHGDLGGIGGVVNGLSSIEGDRTNNSGVSGSFAINTLFATGMLELFCHVKMAKREYIETIDNYFTMYGYKINRMKVPNFNNRRNHNYVKCSTVNITGNIPSEAITFLESLLYQGCTFWHSSIGSYSNNNEVR